MLVGVVSDSHGNREGLLHAGKRLQKLGAAFVCHLGDDYQDRQVLEKEGFQVLAVPGLYCPEYSRPEIPNRLVVELGGVKMLLTHTPGRHGADLPGDPDPEAPDPGVRLVLYGHTHQPLLQRRGPVLYLNPGHVRPGKDRGFPPTFALLSLSPSGVKAEIRRLRDGALILLREETFPF
jgi:putative phosphoesterase